VDSRAENENRYCDYECTLCSQACPTHAIQKLIVEDKQKLRIGTAFFDRNRWLALRSARSCVVCEEHCPTPKKAIWFQECSNDAGWKFLPRVKQPRLNPDLCTGCGICEKQMPHQRRARRAHHQRGRNAQSKNQFSCLTPIPGTAAAKTEGDTSRSQT